VGTIQPVKDLARVCLEHEAILHLDSTQAVGWLETAPADLAGLGLMSFASHKIGGPSGAGALWVRSSGAGRLGHPSLRARDIQDEIRPGTLPVPAIMGFGAAAEVFRLRRAEFAATAARQVWDLWTQIRDGLDPAIRDRCILQGPGLADPGVDWSRASDKARLPNNLNFGVEGAAGQELYGHLSGRVACSPGSACRTRRGESSAVLRAMGIPAERAHATLRLGLSPGFPEEQITSAAEIIAAAIRRSVWC
jgi:cysteine desulfurase